MRFFNIKNRDVVLSGLHGLPLQYYFSETGLTENINRIRRAIENELRIRNWDVPGVNVEMVVSYQDGGYWYSPHKISCMDGGVDVSILSWEVRNEGMVLSLHDDMSGSLDLYCGSNWMMDRHNFVHSTRIHQKMQGKPKTVLQYDLYQNRFVSTDDCGRAYIPEGDERESYTLAEVVAHVLEGLQAFLSHIQSFEVPAPADPMVEPDPVYLTNGIFTGSRFTTKISSEDLEKIQAKKKLRLSGGWRLLPFSAPAPPAEHPLAYLMNDGFVYCGIEWPDGRVDDHDWHQDAGEKTYLQLHKFDGVFLVDQAVADDFRKRWFEENPDEDILTNKAYNEMCAARAATLVHINDYAGDFRKPVVLIARAIASSEIAIAQTDDANTRN